MTLADAEDEEAFHTRTGTDQISLFHCPHAECDRTEPFARKQDLLRHYMRYVPCNEICPFCHETFNQARQYIAHKCKRRKPGDKSKNQYVKERHQELRRLTAELLHQASLRQRLLFNGHGSGRKRDRETAGLHSPVQEGKRIDIFERQRSEPIIDVPFPSKLRWYDMFPYASLKSNRCPASVFARPLCR
ncbi:hypothetical protein VTK26DRAFT_724 [Humicola hyalothermophila]